MLSWKTQSRIDLAGGGDWVNEPQQQVQQPIQADWRQECKYTNNEWWQYKKTVLVIEEPTWTDNLYTQIREITPPNFVGLSLVVGIFIIGYFGFSKIGVLKLLLRKEEKDA